MSRITRTIKIDTDIWKGSKKLAIDEDTNLSALIETLLNRELKKRGKHGTVQE